jgi:hypothetical protein
MRSRNIILLPLVLLVSSCWETSAHNMQASSGQLVGGRDKAMEDQVAKLFETTRANAKLPPLTRIRHRDILEQEVCTIAQADTLGNRHSGERIALYQTAQPQSISPELATVASFNQQRTKNNQDYRRYSVAVWQVKDSQTGQATYWVGVALYWSAFEEFVDNHFTDDVFYHDLWKKHVAPQCRGK